jgi:hypothetical protein
MLATQDNGSATHHHIGYVAPASGKNHRLQEEICGCTGQCRSVKSNSHEVGWRTGAEPASDGNAEGGVPG